MSPSSVHEALERALAKRKLLTDEQMIAQKHEHTMMLEHKLEEAVDAWERSKRNTETERIVEKTLGKPIEGEEFQPHGGSLKRTKRGPINPPSVLAEDAEPGNWDIVDFESIPGYFYDEKTGEETLPEERAGIMATWIMEQMKAGRDPAAVQMILERTVTTTTAGRSGDPRYLAEFRACLAEIRKIWGTDAPVKQEFTGKDGAPISVAFSDSLARVYGLTPTDDPVQ
ncbi:hypothetical protein [Armatimonas sp.]|uniref:hypothetical protein n=1 Tax=Armatimonas sp. TaxID=1872638 RepID=UPI00374DC3B2